MTGVKPYHRLAVVVLLLSTGFAIARPAWAASPTCKTSSTTGFQTTVCVTVPANGATVAGKVPVTATVTTTGSPPPLNGVQYSLDGTHLLFDFQSPYTFTLHTYLAAPGLHQLGASASFSGGYATPATTILLNFWSSIAPKVAPFVPTAGTDPPTGQPFVLAVGGDGATGLTAAQQVDNLIASWNPNLFMYLGDIYQEGRPEEYLNWYGENGSYFSRFRAITDPVIGNHEYTVQPGAEAYFGYWGNPPHYYSVNTHGWHIVSLDDTGEYGAGATSSAQYQWLQRDLATNTSPCVLVGFHRPVYTLNPSEAAGEYFAYWQLLNQYHVTLVVNGHSHSYQRWLPLNADGVVSPTGVNEFVVGTAGNWISGFAASDSRVAAGFDTTATAWGALKLGLSPAGATYQFQTIGGQTEDFGSAACQGAPDSTAPTTPDGLTATPASGREADLAWKPAADNVGVTSYQVLRDGVAIGTAPGYRTTYADTTVGASTSYRYSVVAVDAAGNTSTASPPATVTTPAARPTYVQGASSGTSSRVGSTTVALTKPVRSGDLLVGWFGQYDAAGPVEVSDDVDGAWTRVQGERFSNGNGDAALYYTHAAAAAPNGLTVTVKAASPTYLQAAVGEYWGTSAAGTLLTSSVGAGTGATADSGATTAVPAGSLVFAGLMTGGAPGTVSPGRSAGVQLVMRSSTASNSVDAADATSSAGGTQRGQFTLTSSTNWYAGAAVFRPATGNDTSAPSVPTGVTAAAGPPVTISWTASSDDLGVAGYVVLRDGAAVGDVPSTKLVFSDTSAAAGKTYSYSVTAYDAAGNVSAPSAPATITTPAAVAGYVQSGVVATGARASSATIPLIRPVAPGDLLVGWFGQYDAAGAVQVSDDVNGAWTRVQGTTFSNGSGDVALYYVKSTAAASGVTVRIAAASPTYLQGSAGDYGGGAVPGSLVGSAVASGNGTAASSGPTPTGPAGALVVTALITGGNPGAVTPGPTAGATPTVRAATGSGSVVLADVRGASAGQQAGAFTLGTATDWYAMAAVFAP